MINEYIKARKAGEKEYKMRLAMGKHPYVPALDDILPERETLSQQSIGLKEIPVELIVGTRTRARQNSFALNFMPLMDADTEFAMKWSNLYKAQENEGFNSPIKVYEYLHKFYVQEGNKRVSVSKFLDLPSIMAEVVRIIPSAEVLAREPAYEEFMRFYKVAPIYDIVCTVPGSYAEIAKLLGREIPPKASGSDETAGKVVEPWPEEAVRSLKTAYWSFTKVVRALQEKVPAMPLGDAFIVYLSIFLGEALENRSEKDVEKRLKSIRNELFTAYNRNNVSLVESPDRVLKAGGIVGKAEKIVTGKGIIASKVIPAYSDKKPFRAAFIYDKQPEDSNWIYNHEAGRLRLGKMLGDVVVTKVFVTEADKACDAGKAGLSSSDEGRVYCGSFEDAVGAAAAWGADVVFTTSVRQMADTLRAAIEHKDIVFLNCSINLAHQAVRTYYAKLYEAKFLAGFVAGTAAAADGTHRIGYCSDYPIYGTIASINAFAIGAAMADPEVTIELGWSGSQQSNGWWSMADRGIHIISAIDSMHNTDGSNAYGVCYVEKCEPGEGTDQSGMYKISNLAAPIWKWGKFYEIIIRSIMDGTYHSKFADNKYQATNYWWGMMSGVVDIELSDELSHYTRRLIGILRSNILNGTVNPFDGELRSQTDLIRRVEDEPLSAMDVITMDWLNENIIGEIPATETLTEAAREAVSVSGVRH